MDAIDGEMPSKGPRATEHEYEVAFYVELTAIARVWVCATSLAEAKAKAGAALDQIAEIDLSECGIPGREVIEVTEAWLRHDPNEAPFEVWRDEELIEEMGMQV